MTRFPHRLLHQIKQGRIAPSPDYLLSVEGRDVSAVFRHCLISLSLAESRAEEADTLDLVLDDSYSDLAIPNCGAEVRLSMGWCGSPLVEKGSFTVVEVEHCGAPDIVIIRARAASVTQELHHRREHSWHDKTLDAIVRTIAVRHSLQPAISAKFKDIVIAHIDQTLESDLSFLTRLAKRYDAVMNIKDRHLLFMPIGAGKTASGRTLDVVSLSRSSGDAHRYHVSQSESFDAVRAHFQSNAHAARESVIVGEKSGKNVKVLPQTYPNQADAQAAAQAALTKTKRRRATLAYTLALGRPEIYPEMLITVSGFKHEIDACQWLVKRTRHDLSVAGLTTYLALEIRAERSESSSLEDEAALRPLAGG